jgi:voltage-gated sodium channel
MATFIISPFTFDPILLIRREILFIKLEYGLMICKIGDFVEGALFQKFVMALIILNAAALGAETSPELMNKFGPELMLFDHFVLVVFAIEIGIKLINRRLEFFKNYWNIFDFVIVGIALVPSSGPLAVMRTLRIFRAMRLLSIVPSMRKVVQALFYAIPGILSVGSIILLIFYISSVLTTNFFGAQFDEWFGSIGRSMYSLFQIMTLESWSMGIVRPVMQVYPAAWIFFVTFILITSFAVLNLFIGIIVDAMQQQSYAEQQASQEETVQEFPSSTLIHKEVVALRAEIRELKDLIHGKTI